MSARVAYGALYSYYKTNQGTRFGIDFWESILEDHIEHLHVAEVWNLMIAFRDNRSLHRDHFRNLLDTQFKKVILDKWKAEVIYHQRLLVGLAVELHNLEYYDEEIWLKLFETAI